jgi:N-methylhydantoinase B
MLGGKDGAPHDYRIVSGDSSRALKTKEFGIGIAAGDRLEIRSSGGGGWGPPERRSAEARQRDIDTEFTSA